MILPKTVKSLPGGPGGCCPHVREAAGGANGRPLADHCKILSPNQPPTPQKRKTVESGILLDPTAGRDKPFKRQILDL